MNCTQLNKLDLSLVLGYTISFTHIMKCSEPFVLAQEPKNKVHAVCIKKLELFRFLQDNNEKEE